MTVRKILVLNGPNLDLLGMREPEVYGNATLESLENTVTMYAAQHGVSVTCFQSNSEGKLIGRIHSAARKYDGIVFNPGAYTHYSYAIRDAIAAIDTPVVEVHLSDIDAREAFRRVSVIAPACVAQVKGFGIGGYCRGIDILLENSRLPRLGEGYEARFSSTAHIRVAGREDAELAAIDAELAAIDTDAAQTGPLSANEGGTAASDMDATWTGPLSADEGGTAASDADTSPTGPIEPAPADQRPSLNEIPVVETRSTLLQNIPSVPESLMARESGPAIISLPKIEAMNFGAVSRERQAKVRSACAMLGLSAMLVRDTSNIRWLTAFDGVFDTERAHALLIEEGHATLHTDSRYANAMRAAAESIGSDIEIDESRMNHMRFAAQSLAAGAHGVFDGLLGFEDSITYAEFINAADEFNAKRLVPTNDMVLGLRAVKDSAELSRMRAAQEITDAAFLHIVTYMKPGMTEREVQLELESFMMRHGADGLAFGSIVACGENGADPHAVPSDKRLEAGQCVVMDFGAKAFGYCSDMTRMVFLGQPAGRMADAWEVLRRANETVEEILRPGVTGREAHDTAERVLAEGGFGGKMGHGLGHGVGLECHELPVLNTRNDQPLAEGNVVTVEPGIYLQGEFGMRLEDCGVVTADGYDVFSKLGHEMVVI